MKAPFISFMPQNQDIRAEVLEAVARVFDSQWYVLGNSVKQFKSEYNLFSTTIECIGLANGLDVLHLALKVLYIKKEMK